jgi:starch synthase
MKTKNLKVLFAASECTPIAKVGGLGDVIGSLPKALKKLGVDVRIVIPEYKIVKTKRHKFSLKATKVKVKNSQINVFQGFLPESRVILYLLEKEQYFAENGIYFEKSAFVSSFKEIQRFLFFSLAVLETFQNINWRPDILHCHDWHTAIIAPLLKSKNWKIKPKTLLTIHNLANQGKWRTSNVLRFLSLEGNEINSIEGKDERKKLNILAQGILNADLLNTVSPTYAKEILTKKYGEGLEKILLKRKKDLHGILNGIDQERFNPREDSNIKTNYSVRSLIKKKENKVALQGVFNLPGRDVPLFGFISRLTYQKGVDLIEKIIPWLVNSESQLVILGTGEKKYEETLSRLTKKYPYNISARIKFDPVLAQKIYAGSDFFLMPSRFEPCGLGQLISQRYGTIPIVRETGGLSDTVEEQKTGFLFKRYKLGSFWKAVKRALNIYRDKKKLELMQKRTMKKDFSWKNSAKEYLKLYNKLAVD